MKFHNIFSRLGLGLVFSTALILGSFGLSAQGSDFQSARTAALGGAGHAGPMLNDAIYLNPSYASFLPTYAIGGNWVTFNGKDDHFKGRAANLTVQDGRNEYFQAGVGYTLREDGSFV